MVFLRFFLKGNNVLLDSKTQKKNLNKQISSASIPEAGGAGGAEGACGAYRRVFENGI